MGLVSEVGLESALVPFFHGLQTELFLEQWIDVEKSELVALEFDVVALVSCEDNSVDCRAVLLEGLYLFGSGGETAQNKFASGFVAWENNGLQEFDVDV